MPDIELQLDRPPPDASLRPDLETRSSTRSNRPAQAASGSGSVESTKDLACKILGEITPALRNSVDKFQLSGSPVREIGRKRAYVFRSVDIAEFTTLAICSNCDIWLYVEIALDIGATVEQILEELLAPAARRLGDMWESDDCDFLGVTTATHRLQTAVRRMSQHHWMKRQGRPRALLAAAPGETHVLGVAIVRTYFENCGWSADLAGGGDLEAAVRRHWYELVAISISCDRFIDALAKVAVEVRKASRNRSVFLLVGGPIVASDPGLAARIGADAGAATPQEAIGVTRSLLRRGARL